MRQLLGGSRRSVTDDCINHATVEQFSIVAGPSPRLCGSGAVAVSSENSSHRFPSRPVRVHTSTAL